MTDKPKPKNSLSEKELDRADAQFKAFDEEVKSMTLDRMNAAPKEEVAPQTQLSQRDIERSKEIYLKPKRAIGSREPFNEKFREAYNFDKEYVHFIAENREVIGETISMWTKPYPGLPAEEWDIPVNKPVWAPRYVASQIKRAVYHRLEMQDKITSSDGTAQYYGQMTVDKAIQRLDATPVSSRKSIFMGASGF